MMTIARWAKAVKQFNSKSSAKKAREMIPPYMISGLRNLTKKEP